MRQQLPEDAGYPLNVNGVGPVHPGDVFDAPLPVPGCVLLDAAEDATDGAVPAQDGPADPGAGDGGGGAPEGTGAHSETADPPAERAPARRNSPKGARA